MENEEQETEENFYPNAEASNKKFPIQRIAIFASGAGSNTKRIIDYFKNSVTIKIALIVCNNAMAGVLQIAQREKVPYLLIDKKYLADENLLLSQLHSFKINFIVLAGFLWKIPSKIISAYQGNIINIHPALLPDFGGKGMYGEKVHEAVIKAGKKESGITIHYVDEIYDHGKIIYQAKCSVDENDTADSLAKKIHELEYASYPHIIEQLVLK